MRRTIAASLLAALSVAAGGAAPQVAVDVVGGRVHIPVSVNGAPPASFILDTGAARSPIDAAYAKSLGLSSVGQGHAYGAGGGQQVGIAPDVTMTVGGVTHRIDRAPMTRMKTISLRIGQPVSGVLGYEVLSKYVTEIDYANETVRFHPKSFSPPREAVRLPIRFTHNLPMVDVKMTTPDGRELAGRFLVDTGAGFAVALTRAFAEKNKIEIEGGIDMSVGIGVGGATQDRIGRLPSFSVGGFTFERPVVNLSRDTQGVLSKSDFDGLIGGPLLRRFTLFVDYPRKQIALVPNAKLRDPFEFDMSGLLFAAADETFTTTVVQNVLPGSPAAEAGFRAGDELRAIDGKPVLPRDFEAIRLGFRVPDKKFEVTIARDGAESKVQLVTRRLL